MELFVISIVSSKVYFSLRRVSEAKLAEVETFCSENCNPSLKSKVLSVVNNTPYFASPYCYIDNHGQLQTFIQFNLRNISRLLNYYFFPKYRVQYNRELLVLRDGGTIALDWAYNNDHSRDNSVPLLSPTSPMVIMYHGLVGDSQSEYIIHLAEDFLRKGYRVVVMVARGCGGLEITSGSLFAGSRIQDIHECILRARGSFPRAEKVFMIGFSLGAALTLQYLGSTYANQKFVGDFRPNALENGEFMLTAAMVVSPPWLCVNNNIVPPSTMFAMWSYLLVMPLKIYYLTHQKSLRKYAPEVYKNISTYQTLMCTNVSQFDELFYSTFQNAQDQRVYKCLDDYYRDISPVHSVGTIAIPTLAVSALDDPICPHSHAPTDCQKLGEGITVIKTDFGGHLGFPEGWLPLTSAWTDRLAANWVRSFIENDDKGEGDDNNKVVNKK